MKKSIGLVGVISCFMALSANAQTPATDTLQPPTTPVPQTQTWDPQKNKTVKAITAKYKDKYATKRDSSTIADIYPVIGNYESTTNADAPNVAVSLDPENKGIVWIDGLPQGRVKAMLRQSPATYKIPVQKTEDGKDIPEGVLIFDKEMKTLSIALGSKYNVADPASAFLTGENGEPVVVVTETDGEKTKIKTKTVKNKNKDKTPKAWIYTGSKVEIETVKN